MKIKLIEDLNPDWKGNGMKNAMSRKLQEGGWETFEKSSEALGPVVPHNYVHEARRVRR